MSNHRSRKIAQDKRQARIARKIKRMSPKARTRLRKRVLGK